MSKHRKECENNGNMSIKTFYLPNNVMMCVDNLIKQGYFKSRSTFLRTAMYKYLQEFYNEIKEPLEKLTPIERSDNQIIIDDKCYEVVRKLNF